MALTDKNWQTSYMTEENAITAADIAIVIASRPDKRALPPQMIREGARVIDRALGHLQEMSPGLAEELAEAVYIAMSFTSHDPT